MSGRKYQVGDTIPGRGTVTEVTLTAYLVDDPFVPVVPFYGPAGADDLVPQFGLVEFADGSRYGGVL